MAKKKAEDLKGKTADELSKTLVDLKKQQLNLRFQKSQGQLANTATIRETRRQVARVKTAQAVLDKGALTNTVSAAKPASAAPKKAAKKAGKAKA
jgi:large subunit ribosomal protein L29